MDMQKEREAFESWFKDHIDDNTEFDRYSNEVDSPYFDGFVNATWMAWQAKAQAVPEGFVVVPKEPTDEMLFAASGRDIVAEHYGGENIMWSEVRETWKAMLEAAQEPDND
ncbi:hypothetical protein [Acinetobacter schindleri]|uniref:hypothetical protein n=1 Tax=Acinetobacter schindleri TaxID=108981 RepID=UPI00161654F1|nr:hypothetical protein [Acinetobacter schindleri]MBB4835019.1 hypothetical protein [Acinetobacter schindleri]